MLFPIAAERPRERNSTNEFDIHEGFDLIISRIDKVANKFARRVRGHEDRAGNWCVCFAIGGEGGFHCDGFGTVETYDGQSIADGLGLCARLCNRNIGLTR